MAGEAEFLSADEFSDRQGERGPGLPIALLAMGRDGIVNLSLHAVVEQITLERVALRAEYGEDVPDAITVRIRNAEERILHLIYIYRSNLLAPLILCIEVTEFHVKHGSLQLINATIAALIKMDVLLTTSVIGDGPDDLCQIVIIGSDSPCITKGAEILAGVKTMAGGITKGTGATGLRRRLSIHETTAMSLRIILDELQMMAAADVADERSIGTAAIEMDYHQGTGAPGDGSFDEGVVNLEGVG